MLGAIGVPSIEALFDRQIAPTLLDTQPARQEISARLTEMIHHDHVGGPVLRNGYYYFSERGAEQDLLSFYRRKQADGKDEVRIGACWCCWPGTITSGGSTSVKASRES